MLIKNTTTSAITKSLFWFFNLLTSVLGFSAYFSLDGVSYLLYFSISTELPATMFKDISISFIVKVAPSTISAYPLDFRIALKFGSFTKNNPPIISIFTPEPSFEILCKIFTTKVSAYGASLDWETTK